MQHQKGKNKLRAGISVLEGLIVIAIIVLMSAQVLVSFTGLNDNAALQHAARDLALNMRTAQNMSISVSQPLGFNEVPPITGIHFANGSGSYVLFADRSPYDFLYNPSTETIQTFQLERNIIINRAIIDGVVAPPTQRENIVFVNPEATLYIVNAANGSSLGDKIIIELLARSGQIKSVVVRTTGQISIR